MEYECEVCAKKFATELQMKEHMQGMHNKKRNYICETCRKTLTYASSLLYHRNLHSGEKDICATSVESDL